jgi:hypothetical protein
MSSRSRIDSIRAAFPSEGLFRDKEWRMSPESFVLPAGIAELIANLGPALRAFQRACNELYFAGGEHSWVAALLDQGKPQDVLDLAKHPRWHDALPSVIRPDLVLTETGVCISELDSLPGGMGLTGWLNQTYAALGDDVLGGSNGMIEGFAAAFPSEDILISRESSDYEPEMHWIAQHLNRRVLRTDTLSPSAISNQPLANIYRFFELWDLANVEQSNQWLTLARDGRVTFTPPLKAFLEEKLWLALFWTPQLEPYWREALSSEHLDVLRQCIPQGWVVDPAPLPPYAELPGLNVHAWDEVKRFGSKARELVLKISGFSEKGWGSRGVFIGHDLSQEDWGRALDEALASFPRNPYLLQRFHRGRVVHHPAWDANAGIVTDMQARVRLCPYYFIPSGTEQTQLGGVLATVCPADKKILHGMKDAMMLPCVAHA